MHFSLGALSFVDSFIRDSWVEAVWRGRTRRVGGSGTHIPLSTRQFSNVQLIS